MSAPPQLTGAIESKETEKEIKNRLKTIFISAVSYFAENNTFEVNDIHQIQIGQLKDGKQYSFWYAIKGVPTPIPGSSQEKTPCDLTTPPTSVAVSSSAKGFIAAVKVNTGNEKCDEWSINDENNLVHTFGSGR
jgi:hypothetical protein